MKHQWFEIVKFNYWKVPYEVGEGDSSEMAPICFLTRSKKTQGLTYKGCVLQRISFGALSDVTVILGMRQYSYGCYWGVGIRDIRFVYNQWCHFPLRYIKSIHLLKLIASQAFARWWWELPKNKIAPVWWRNYEQLTSYHDLLLMSFDEETTDNSHHIMIYL